ncbi:MAG TPA: PIN domain nuclease [Mycobacteriales bacterium]|jgi:hypothetical protein|nr:PIN domain nuclease [Mycobacteriales bacterium]
MAVAAYLLDTSAAHRLGTPAVRDVVAPLLERYLVATCGITNLEALFSARTPDEYERWWTYRNTAFEYLDTLEADWQRAQEVQRMLAARSELRSVKIPDLLIAAVAEREGLMVLHYDEDFDRIAALTGQPVQWVVDRGTVA